MVPVGVTIPGLFAAGHRLSNARAVGLIRFAGIMFPPNCTGTALLPGHAPCAFTAPAHGSMIGALIIEKFPARSSVVGTVALKGRPVRSRNPSQLANQKVRWRPL